MVDVAYNALRQSFLFRTMSEEDFDRARKTIKVGYAVYKKGEVICSPENFSQRVGFLVEGACDVLNKHSSGADVRLRPLNVGDTFGIMSVFSDNEDFPTTIIATKVTEVVYITK